MEATGVVAKALLVVRLNDAPLRDTMENIAKAATAEWHQIDGVYRLERTKALLDRLCAPECHANCQTQRIC